MFEKFSFLRPGIRGKLTFWFVLGAVGAVILGTVVVYASGLSSIQLTLGQTYCQIASRGVGHFEDHFIRENATVQEIATDVLTTEVVLEANHAYRGRSGEWINIRMDRLAGEWRKVPTKTHRERFLHQLLSRRLTVLGDLNESILRLAVYDRYGVVIAASDPPLSRLASESSWFNAIRPTAKVRI